MRYSNWSRWDLHFHTPIDQNYNLKNISDDEWINFFIQNVIKKEQVKMLAFTDHNIININLFLKLKAELKVQKITTNEFRLLPGVEINLDKKIFPNVVNREPQVILIFNDNFNINEFNTEQEYLEKISKIAKDFDKNKEARDVINLLKTYKGFDFIISAEGTKSNGFIELSKETIDNKKQLCNFIISNEFDFFNNQPNEKNYLYTGQQITEILDNSIKDKLKFVRSELAFYTVSDNRDIKKYPFSSTVSNPNFIWSIFKSLNTFQGLKLLTAFPEKINLEKSLKKLSTKSIISKCIINGNTIFFSPDLNIIIGKRSSGKTLLVSQIARYLNKETPELKQKDYDKVININNIQLFDNNENKIISNDKNISENYIMIYPQNSLIDDLEKNKDLLFAIKKLLNININLQTENNSMGTDINKKIENLVKEVKSLDLLFNKINDYNYQPIFQDFLLSQSNDINDWFISFSTELSKNIDYYNNNIESFQNKINENWKLSNLNSLQDLKDIDINIYELIEKEIKEIWESHKIIKTNKNIINKRLIKAVKGLKGISKYLEMQTRNFSDKETVSLRFRNNFTNIKTEIVEIAKLLFLIENNKLNFEKLSEEISSSHSISTYEIRNIETKKIDLKEEFSSFIIVDFLEENTFQILEKLIKTNFEKNLLKKNTDISVAKIQKKIKTNIEIKIIKDGEIREDNSPGAKATIIFEMIYQKIKNDGQSSIIIFDQPDDSIDNEYIVKEMVNIIKDFAKWNQIFIITHNPNLAINTCPDNIIYAYRDNNHNIRYINSAIEYDELIVNDISTTMLSILINIVEGTKEALRKRIETYKKNWGK